MFFLQFLLWISRKILCLWCFSPSPHQSKAHTPPQHHLNLKSSWSIMVHVGCCIRHAKSHLASQWHTDIFFYYIILVTFKYGLKKNQNMIQELEPWGIYSILESARWRKYRQRAALCMPCTAPSVRKKNYGSRILEHHGLVRNSLPEISTGLFLVSLMMFNFDQWPVWLQVSWARMRTGFGVFLGSSWTHQHAGLTSGPIAFDKRWLFSELPSCLLMRVSPGNLGLLIWWNQTAKRRLCISGLQVIRSQTWSVCWSSAQKFRKVNVYMSAALAEASSAAVASGANVERQTLGLRELFQSGH